MKGGQCDAGRLLRCKIISRGLSKMNNEQNEFMQHELCLPEITVRGMVLGALLPVIFTASNVYLGLKVGLNAFRYYFYYSGYADDRLLAWF